MTIEEILAQNLGFKYELLDRMKTECIRAIKTQSTECLEGITADDHIKLMREVWYSFPKDCRPTWIKLIELNRYHKKLKEIEGVVETERKFLIEMPAISELKEKYDCKSKTITQTYLKRTKRDVERRVRQITAHEEGQGKKNRYYYTEKKKINNISREEKEKEISKQEYDKLIAKADINLNQIIKVRTCFTHEDNNFELDIYPFWEDKAILEVELATEDQNISLPKELKIIKEVTEDKLYKNESLANNYNIK